MNINDNTCQNLTAFTRIFFERYIETTNTKPFGKYKAVYFPSITKKKWDLGKVLFIISYKIVAIFKSTQTFIHFSLKLN